MNEAKNHLHKQQANLLEELENGLSKIGTYVTKSMDSGKSSVSSTRKNNNPLIQARSQLQHLQEHIRDFKGQ